MLNKTLIYMSLRQLEPESDQTAKILLRQGRPESACRILESSMSEKAKQYGASSVEFQMSAMENIESLFQSILSLMENKKYKSAIAPLQKIILWTSNGENSLQIQDPTKFQYRAYAFFLNGCAEKGCNNFEPALELFMSAASYFESCMMVTELVASYIGASYSLISLNREDEALIHLRTAQDLLSSPEIAQKAESPIHEAMSLIYMRQGKLDQAKESLELAIKTRSLSDFFPKFKTEPSRCSSSASTHSAGDIGPRPPSSANGSSRIRANMARQKRNSQCPPSVPMKKDVNGLPIKELGQLKLSINRLMSCV